MKIKVHGRAQFDCEYHVIDDGFEHLKSIGAIITPMFLTDLSRLASHLLGGGGGACSAAAIAMQITDSVWHLKYTCCPDSYCLLKYICQTVA